MLRVRLSSPTLLAVLKEEFHARRPAGCAGCRLPQPVRLYDGDSRTPNWDVCPPLRCPEGACVLAKIVRELKVVYDVAP